MQGRIKSFLIALLVACATPALAGPNIIEKSIVTVEAPKLIVYGTATSSAGCTIGVDGCLVSTTISGVAHIAVGSSSIAQLPYAARVRVDLFDSGSNGSIECDSVTIKGTDSKNYSGAEETITSLTETGANSAKAWSKIASIAAAGCGGGGSSDVFRVSMGEEEIGVPVFLSAATDVESLCYYTSGSQYHCASSGWTIAASGYSVAFGSATWTGSGPAPARGDTVLLRVRGDRIIRNIGGGR
jgi:hypothetical protein